MCFRQLPGNGTRFRFFRSDYCEPACLIYCKLAGSKHLFFLLRKLFRDAFVFSDLSVGNLHFLSDQAEFCACVLSVLHHFLKKRIILLKDLELTASTQIALTIGLMQHKLLPVTAQSLTIKHPAGDCTPMQALRNRPVSAFPSDQRVPIVIPNHYQRLK